MVTCNTRNIQWAQPWQVLRVTARNDNPVLVLVIFYLSQMKSYPVELPCRPLLLILLLLLLYILVARINKDSIHYEKIHIRFTAPKHENSIQELIYFPHSHSSPHLMEVRERIRINGTPLSKDKFAKYFFECWDNLQNSKVL